VIRAVELFDRVFRISTPFHPDSVQAVTLRVISLNDRKRRCIFYDNGISSDERFVPDATELVYAGVRSDICAVGDLDMTGERRRIRHDDLVAELAVVSYVGLRHKEVVIPDLRETASAGCTAMDRDELADLIPLSDLSRGFFTAVLQVLWCEAERYEWKNVRVISDGCAAVNYHMRVETHAIAERDIFPDR
jgi:hypothetical protein